MIELDDGIARDAEDLLDLLGYDYDYHFGWAGLSRSAVIETRWPNPTYL